MNMYYVWVALFGVLGALCRYLTGVWIVSPGFPLATLIINIVGCFLLAIVMKYLAELPYISKTIITALGTGFVGSFTTFSTFSLESIQLIEKHWYGTAVLYIAASLIGGLLSSRFGFYVSEQWLNRRRNRHAH